MNAYERLRGWSPLGVLIAGVITGFILLLLSFASGTALLTDPVGSRDVGFISAVNWSVGFTVVVPLTLCFMLISLRSTGRALAFLDRECMITDLDGRRMPDGADRIAAIWQSAERRASRWALVLGGVGFACSIAEWWVYSGRPLAVRSLALTSERDWSVGTLFGSSPPAARALNGAAGFLAFSMQGFFVAALLFFLIFIGVFCDFILRLSDSSTAPVLVPNVRSDDARRGFQLFEATVENILLAAAGTFVLFYLSRMWNLYLMSPDKSLYDFVIGDITRGFEKKGFSGGGAETLAIGQLNYSIVMVTLGALILLALTIAVPLYVLRRAALQSKVTIAAAFENGTADAAKDLSKADAALRLSSMSVWPLGYPKANQLLLATVAAFLCMFFFRIGLLYLGALIAFVLTKAWKVLGADK